MPVGFEKEESEEFKVPKWSELVGKNLRIHLHNGSSIAGAVLGYDHDAAAINIQAG